MGYIKCDITNLTSQFYKNKLKLNLKTQYVSKYIQSYHVSSQKYFCFDKKSNTIKLNECIEKKLKLKKEDNISKEFINSDMRLTLQTYDII